MDIDGEGLSNPLNWGVDVNALGLPICITDPMSREAKHDVDVRAQEAMLTEDAGSGGLERETESIYDRAGRLATKTAYDPNNPDQPTQYSYDPRDRILDIEYPDADDEIFEYDLAGRLTKRIRQNGRTLEYAYDSRGNLTGKTLDDAYSHVYEYDALSRLTLARRDNLSTEDTVAETTFAYDSLSRVTQEVQKLFGETTGKTLLYSYDQRGNRVSLQYSPGNAESIHLKYAYDLLNHNTLVQAKFNTKRAPNRTTYLDIIRYTYSGSLLMTRKVRSPYNDEAQFVNKEVELETEFGYDVHRRITSIDNRTTWDGYLLDNLANYDYEHDDLGNPTSGVGTYSLANHIGYSHIQQRPALEYDRLDRITVLVSEDAHSGSCYQEEFAYDYLGNVHDGTVYEACNTGDPYEFENNPANEYTRYERDNQSFVLEHDDVGNLTRRDVEDDQSQAYNYHYDDEDRLIRIDYGPPGQGTEILAEFEYDALGRLISSYTIRDEAGYPYYGGGFGLGLDFKVHYYYDRHEAIAEYDLADETLVLARRYIHGTARIDERAALIEGHLGLPGPGAPGPTAETFLYLLQELDSVPALIKQNGNLTDANVYSAYGKLKTYCYPRGDFNRDGAVTGIDTAYFLFFGSLAGGAGQPVADPVVDLDLDGDRDVSDWNLIDSTGDADDETLVSSVGNPFHFTGRRLLFHEARPDEDQPNYFGNEQLQFNRARWYDLATSRWLSRDPKGYADGTQ